MHVWEAVDGFSHESDVDLPRGRRFPYGTVGKVCAFLEGPEAADFPCGAHSECGDKVEAACLLLGELVEPVAILGGVAHGGYLDAVGLYPFYVKGEVFQFQVAWDSCEIVLGNENLDLLLRRELLQCSVVVQVVPFKVYPVGNFGLFHDFFPQRRSFYGSCVGECAPVLF